MWTEQPAGNRKYRVLWAAITLLGGLTACDDPRSVQHYEVVQGMVVAVHADTGEVSVEIPQGPVPRAETRSRVLSCIVTRDTELYLNDMFASIDAVEPGDRIQVIGSRDPDPQLDRLAVHTAYVLRAVPPASDPPAALRAVPDPPPPTGETSNAHPSQD